MIVEKLIDDGSKKEDSLIISESVFGVFDGANALDRFFDEEGKSGGLLASSIAKEEFSESDKPLKELAALANRRIREKMLSAGVDLSRKVSLWCTTAAVVRVREGAFDWLQIGDSLILVIHKDDSFELLVNDYDHDREVMVLWKELAQQKKEN